MKKKSLVWIILFIIIYIGMTIILNIKVTTRQGVNFQVSAIKIPLYLKIIDFLDRHYNYVCLVSKIVTKNDTPEVKVKKILSWTHINIYDQPQSLPIIDDHFWHIIVRGYGISDQHADVFTTLCTYAGEDAFFVFWENIKTRERVPFALVKINSRWRVFDPYQGAYFVNASGEFADLNNIMHGPWQVEYLDKVPQVAYDYTACFASVANTFRVTGHRAQIQSPLKRLLFEVKKWVKKNKK